MQMARRELQPDVIVNNRVDKGRQGMQGMDRDDKDYAGDFGTPGYRFPQARGYRSWP